MKLPSWKRSSPESNGVLPASETGGRAAVAGPQGMARMFGLAHDSAPLWRDEELADLARCQLDAKLQTELSQNDPILALHVAAHLRAAGLESGSLRDLLRHPQPPQELLELAKSFLKRLRYSEGAFSAQIASVLYHAVLLVARVQRQERISTLSDASLREGCRWSLQQPWLEPALRQVFEAGLAQLP